MQKTKNFLIIVFTLCVCGCSENFDEAKKAAAYKLIDPASAQFRDLRRRGDHICGQINGKNRMGAYSGYTDFYAFEDNGEWFAEFFPEDSYNNRFYSTCTRKTDKELKGELARGGEAAFFAEIELEKRAQDAVDPPAECFVNWESRSIDSRYIAFNFQPGDDREFEYYDDDIEQFEYGSFVYESPTKISFKSSEGQHKLTCDPKAKSAKMQMPNGKKVDLFPIGDPRLYLDAHGNIVQNQGPFDPNTQYTEDGVDSDGLPYKAGDPLPE